MNITKAATLAHAEAFRAAAEQVGKGQAPDLIASGQDSNGAPWTVATWGTHMLTTWDTVSSGHGADDLYAMACRFALEVMSLATEEIAIGSMSEE